MNTIFYQSPVGILRVSEEDNFIVSLEVLPQHPVEKETENYSPVLSEAKKQLDEYFSGKRFEFDLPLKQKGTAFQKKAWDYLKTIPYGKTVSYKEEAEAMDCPKACRAVGSANGCNTIAIIIPCHRVINTGGKLGGYAYGFAVKQELLNMERQYLLKA